MVNTPLLKVIDNPSLILPFSTIEIFVSFHRSPSTRKFITTILFRHVFFEPPAHPSHTWFKMVGLCIYSCETVLRTEISDTIGSFSQPKGGRKKFWIMNIDLIVFKRKIKFIIFYSIFIHSGRILFPPILICLPGFFSGNPQSKK